MIVGLVVVDVEVVGLCVGVIMVGAMVGEWLGLPVVPVVLVVGEAVVGEAVVGAKVGEAVVVGASVVVTKEMTWP